MLKQIRCLTMVAAGLVLVACSHGAHHGHHHGHDHDHDHHGHHHAANYTAWQNYQCTNGKKMRARYDRKMVEVSFAGRQFVLQYDDVNSNQETAIYSNGKWKWAVESKHGFANTKNSANGFLTQSETTKVNGQAMAVDSILVKNCQPI